MTSSFAHLVTRNEGPLVWVTINRPGDRNAIHTPLMVELERLIQEAEVQEGVRALVFTGAGGTYFIGGADGIEMARLSAEEAMAFSRRIQGLFDRMEQSPLVLVSAINGLCFGGGFEFALACDLRVAQVGSRIGLPEVKVGIIPGGGGTQRLPRLVGMGKAVWMILSGKLYPAEEAASLGLVHTLAPEGELKPVVEELLEPILNRPPHAVSLAKRALYASRMGERGPEGYRMETKAFGCCFEDDFFRKLMRRQLREGLLPTTEDVSALLEEP